MQARTILAFTLVASALVACSVTPRDTETVGESTQAMLPRGTEPPDVPTTPLPRSCPSQRVDLYRNATNCVMPPPSTQGTWSIQPLFPNAPLAIRNRLCAYTWQPKDTVSTCAPAPHTTIARNEDERLGLRGHCPLGSTGCGTTVWVAYDSTPNAGMVGTGTLTMSASKTTSSSSGTTTTGTASQKPSTTSSSSSGTVPGTVVTPSGTVGCCDACAEVQEHFAYVVLPENTEFSAVEFYIPYENEAGVEVGQERIYIEDPDTNVIQVNLNPSRRYRIGPLTGVHPFE